MASLTDVRTALADILSDNISGLNTYRRVPGAIVAPAVVIYPGPMDYLFAYQNPATSWEFDLIVAVPGDDDYAQDPLDELIDATGARSIPAVLLANPKLGRSDCNVKAPLRMTNYGAKVKFGDVTYVGATIRVGVLASH